MGTSFESTCTAPSTQLDKVIGIIPRAARQIFDGIQTKKEEAKARGLVEPVFEVSVTFIEVGHCRFLILITSLSLLKLLLQIKIFYILFWPNLTDWQCFDAIDQN